MYIPNKNNVQAKEKVYLDFKIQITIERVQLLTFQNITRLSSTEKNIILSNNQCDTIVKIPLISRTSQI